MSQMEKKPSNIVLFFRRIKELWGNPRGRAALLLGFYGLFLLFVVGGVKTSLSNEPKRVKEEPSVKEEKTSTFETMNNYEFEMKVNKDNEMTIFQGKRNDTSHFFVNKQTNLAYYMEDKMLYQVSNGGKTPLVEPLYSIDITKFQPDFLEILLDQSTLDYTTNYASGVIKKNYILSLSAFMKLMYGTTISSQDVITLTTTEKNKKIEQVVIDLLGYQKTIDHNSTQLSIDIIYKNIGAVEVFHID